MSEKKLTNTEWWTALRASKILGIPYNVVREAYRNPDSGITEHYFRTSRAYAKANEVRAWADRSPTTVDGDWL